MLLKSKKKKKYQNKKFYVWKIKTGEDSMQFLNKLYNPISASPPVASWTPVAAEEGTTWALTQKNLGMGMN